MLCQLSLVFPLSYSLEILLIIFFLTTPSKCLLLKSPVASGLWRSTVIAYLDLSAGLTSWPLYSLKHFLCSVLSTSHFSGSYFTGHSSDFFAGSCSLLPLLQDRVPLDLVLGQHSFFFIHSSITSSIWFPEICISNPKDSKLQCLLSVCSLMFNWHLQMMTHPKPELLIFSPKPASAIRFTNSISSISVLPK